MKMVISYDSVNRVLDALINDYKKDKNYPKTLAWQDIVRGISLAKDTIYSDIRLREGYSHAISSMDREELFNLKREIINRISVIDSEDKVTAFCVEVDGFDQVFKTAREAFAEASKELNDLVGDDAPLINISIRPVSMPLSEFNKLS